jgi:RNA 3'-terminal phosphate cyclase (ATP)
MLNVPASVRIYLHTAPTDMRKGIDGLVRHLRRYCNADVPVGEHLADQLLLPLGIAAHFGIGGGEFRTLGLSEHARSHIEILRKFLAVEIWVEVRRPDDVLVRIVRSNA